METEPQQERAQGDSAMLVFVLQRWQRPHLYAHGGPGNRLGPTPVLAVARDIVKTCGSKRAMDSHAEVRSMHRRNGLRWSAHFDLRCNLAPKDV